jgi:probable HAF family extracellular repeat protein
MDRILSRAIAAAGLASAVSAYAEVRYEVVELPVKALYARRPTATAINEAGAVAANVALPRQRSRAYVCPTAEQCEVVSPATDAHPRYDFVADLNDLGWSVGTTVPGKTWQAVLYTQSGATLLGSYDNDPKLYSQALGVNNAGVIVGAGAVGTPQQHVTQGFVWRDGTMSWLDSAGSNYSALNRINDAGVAAGSMAMQIGAYTQMRAIAYDTATGSIQVYGPRSTQIREDSFGYAINAAGDIAGQLGLEAMRTSGGKVQALGMLPDHHDAAAYGINDQGETVGASMDYTNLHHAFIHDGTGMHDLNELIDDRDAHKYWILSATDINNHGDITATAVRRQYSNPVAVVLKRIAP